MQTRLRVERYHQNKKMKPMEQNVRTPFGNITNIQLSGTIDSFVIDECTHIRGTHKIMIFLCFLDVDADKMNIYEEPSDSGINTPSDYQGWLCMGHAYLPNTMSYLSHSFIFCFIVLKYIYTDAYSRTCMIYVLILLSLSYKSDIGWA
jgi:hypothetical protein